MICPMRRTVRAAARDRADAGGWVLRPCGRGRSHGIRAPGIGYCGGIRVQQHAVGRIQRARPTLARLDRRTARCARNLNGVIVAARALETNNEFVRISY